jgi:hypothetical protein
MINLRQRVASRRSLGRGQLSLRENGHTFVGPCTCSFLERQSLICLNAPPERPPRVHEPADAAQKFANVNNGIRASSSESLTGPAGHGILLADKIPFRLPCFLE